MKRILSLAALSLLLVHVAGAETGEVTVDGRPRQWLASDEVFSAGQSEAFCETQGLSLVSTAEGMAILEASQTAGGNGLLGASDSQTFWTRDRGFSIDGITIIPSILVIPYPGIFHKVVKVYKYQQMAEAEYYDVVNQPFLWGFRHRALCISN